MKMRLAALAVLPFALAACDMAGLSRQPAEDPAATEEPAGPPRPPEVSPLQQPIEIAGAEQRAVATAEASTVDTRSFMAQGEGWSVEIQGDVAQYRRGGNPRSVAVNRLVFARGVEYVGVLDGAPFALTIRGTACGNAPMTASLRAGGRTLSGCAAPAEARTLPRPAPQPAARATTSRPAATRPAATPAPASRPATTPAAETPATPAPSTATTPATPPAAEPATPATPTTPAAPAPATPATPAPAAEPAAPAAASAPATPAPAQAPSSPLTPELPPMLTSPFAE
ncbi:MAG: hypothetical protein Q4G14_03850 [Paracoccus sp. (in: a-proteobacteria)]|uniref:hypothetical protein n=1 Tax=Paracoccus sp. TaxID=267 RepID=UPI0026DEFCC1|nr:hypothetical protein [Paracoccus sp. (in: a-proteobacteria)]MDO5612361.1 hypothetical protein [Paracoccus sp. (in: a-proteobacteria)]